MWQGESSVCGGGPGSSSRGGCWVDPQPGSSRLRGSNHTGSAAGVTHAPASLSSRGLKCREVEAHRAFTGAGGTGPARGAAATARMTAVANGTVMGAVGFKNTALKRCFSAPTGLVTGPWKTEPSPLLPGLSLHAWEDEDRDASPRSPATHSPSGRKVPSPDFCFPDGVCLFGRLSCTQRVLRLHGSRGRVVFSLLDFATQEGTLVVNGLGRCSPHQLCPFPVLPPWASAAL